MSCLKEWKVTPMRKVGLCPCMYLTSTFSVKVVATKDETGKNIPPQEYVWRREDWTSRAEELRNAARETLGVPVRASHLQIANTGDLQRFATMTGPKWAVAELQKRMWEVGASRDARSQPP